MGWADHHIRELESGRIVSCRPKGGSMRGRIESGQLVTIDPSLEPRVDDAVMCRCKGTVYIHLVKAIRLDRGAQQFLIGNNRGGINGWIGRRAIYGVVTAVSD